MIGHSDKDNKLKAFIKEFRPEINFVLIFVTGLVVLFLLVNNPMVADTVIEPITVAETWVAGKILGVIGYENVQDGAFLSSQGGRFFRMEVRNNCNGVYDSIVFLMAFIAIQIPWRRKIGWMSFGFFLFHVINELRLVTLFIVGIEYPEKFVFFHETFWNYTLVLLTLAIFIFCAHKVSQRQGVGDGEPTADPAGAVQ